ncbi:hypothetical protein BH23GEM5_BH23GEM5_19680 [soil metagenome]
MPDAPGGSGGSNLPANRLSSQELEAVIRRAMELQTADGRADEGISEAEVVRIGQELGLEPAHVRRAITDVRSLPPEEQGLVANVMGPGRVRVARTMRGSADEVRALVEEYLLRCEYMMVQRRFPDSTRYRRDSSMAAGLGRMARQFGTREPRLDLKEVDVVVMQVDDETAFVELSVDLSGDRTGFVAGGAVAGTVMGLPPAMFALFTAAPDLLALVGIPLFGAWMLGMRAGYRYTTRQTQEKLESFLDRLEHRELRLPASSEWGEALKRLKPPRF